MRYRNIIASLVLLALTAWYAYLTAGLPERTLPNTPGPSFFPWLITGIMTILSVSLLIQGLVGGGGTELLSVRGRPLRQAGVFLIVFLAYLSILPLFGFIIASIPFFFALMLIYGQRNIAWLIGFSLVVPVLLLLIFQKIFQVQLPEGVLTTVLG